MVCGSRISKSGYQTPDKRIYQCIIILFFDSNQPSEASCSKPSFKIYRIALYVLCTKGISLQIILEGYHTYNGNIRFTSFGKAGFCF